MHRNQVGISTNIFKNPSNMSDIIALLAPNFKKIEIEVEGDFRRKYLLDKSQFKSELQIISEIKHLYDLDLSLHAPYLGAETDISNEDKTIRNNAVDLFMEMAEFTRLLEIEKITIHPGYLNKSLNKTQIVDNLKISLEKLNINAKQENITFLLENTGDSRPAYIVLNDEDHISICNEFDNIFVTLDLVHFHSFNYNDENYYSKLKKLLPCIKNVHFADMQNNHHQHLPLQYGNFKFEDNLKFMVDNGYTGNFIIEETGGAYKSYEFVDAALRYCQG